MTTKIYAARDSATSALRKIGLSARDYDLFITKTDGKFEVNISAAEAHLKSLKSPVKAVEVAVKAAPVKAVKASPVKAVKVAPVKAAPVKPKAAPGKSTVASFARSLILGGKTNEEVFAALKESFNVDDSKKHYAGWYRRQMTKSGLLSA